MKTPIESWQNRIGLDDAEFYRVINLLNSSELVRLVSGHVEAMEEDRVLTDHIQARFRLEVVAENRALVVGETLSGFVKLPRRSWQTSTGVIRPWVCGN